MISIDSIYSKYSKYLNNKDLLTHKDEPLQIMLMGEFNAGKSSLTNALIGMNVLPVDIFQTTATINRIRYSPSPSFSVIDSNNSKVFTSDNLDKLRDYNADVGSFENIKWIEIGSPGMPEGLEFIDTPGFNDPNPLRDTTFLSILPYADIIIFVCDANQALKGSEIPYIKKYFLNALSRTFFVFNHSDTLANATKPKIIRQSVETALSGLINESSSLYAGYGCEDIAKQTQGIRLSDHVYFISALLAVSAEEPNIDPELATILSEDFANLKNRIFSSVAQRDQIIQEWQIRTALNQLQTRFDKILSMITIFGNHHERKHVLQASMVDKLTRQIESYKKILKKLHILPEEIRRYLDDEIPKGLDRLRSAVQALGDDMGGTFLSQVYEQQMQGIVQRLIEGSKGISKDALTQSLDLSMSKMGSIHMEPTVGIKSQYSRQIDLQKIGITASMVGTVAWLLLGPIGAVAGVVVTGIYQMNALKQQRGEMDTAYDDLKAAAEKTLDSVKIKISEATYAMIKSFEVELLKSGDKIQWDLIELSEYASTSDERAKKLLLEEKEQLLLGINECRRQLSSLGVLS